VSNQRTSILPASLQRKVLLVDTATSTRNLRAKALRDRGLDVVCAGGLAEGRSLWQPNAYRLVLMHIHNDAYHATEFREEIKHDSPEQLVAFLVGRPHLLASTPGPDGAEIERDHREGWASMVAAILANGCKSIANRGGILEAAMRISAARTCQQAPDKTNAVFPAAIAPPVERSSPAASDLVSDFASAIADSSE
jgi:CheY-like chemotaxis protein